MANSGVNGVVRPVGTTYVGVDNVVRAVNRTCVGVENAVRTVNRAYVGVYAPFVEVRVVLRSISLETVDPNSGAITGTTAARTLAETSGHASVTVNEAGRVVSIQANQGGRGVTLDFSVSTVGDTQAQLLSALNHVESFSMTVSCQAWYGGHEAEGQCSSIFLGYSFHPDGWRNSFSETKTFTKAEITASSLHLFNGLRYGGYTVEQLTLPATAKVNGIDIPVTLVNQMG